MNRQTGRQTWGRRHRHVPERIRRMRLHLDAYTCQRCGLYDPTGAGLEVDEITPQSQGGLPRLDNTQTLCRPCHKPKTQAEALAGKHRAQRPRPRHPADLLAGGPTGRGH